LFNATLELNMVKIPSSNTVPHITVTDGQLTTTSRDVAEAFGKRHSDVIERITKLDCSEDFRVRNFPQASFSVKQPNGGATEYTEYRITRDGFSFLCMGFTGAKAAQWKERYISTFNAMAAKLAEPVPSLQFRRFLMWYDDHGVEQVKNVPMDATVISPSNPDKLAEFLLHEVPQHLLGEAIATLTGRALRLLNDHQRQSGATATTTKRIG
jgi:Rha family phage regulatory protein